MFGTFKLSVSSHFLQFWKLEMMAGCFGEAVRLGWKMGGNHIYFALSHTTSNFYSAYLTLFRLPTPLYLNYLPVFAALHLSLACNTMPPILSILIRIKLSPQLVLGFVTGLLQRPRPLPPHRPNSATGNGGTPETTLRAGTTRPRRKFSISLIFNYPRS